MAGATRAWRPVASAQYHQAMTKFLTYLRDLSDGANNVELARIADVHKATVGRWDETSPNLEPVIRLARHYNRPVLEMLVAAGLITDDDAARTPQPFDIGSLSNHALMRELNRRLDGLSHPPATMQPRAEEEPNPDDYDLAAGHIERPDDQPAD